MFDVIRNEPLAFFAALGTAIMAGVAMVVTFGFSLTPEQILAIEGFVAAVFGVPILLFTRSKVTPTANIENIPVDAPGPPAPTTTVGDILENK